jgi:chaperonin GroEL
MEYNLPSEIVKDLNFGDSAKTRIIRGVEKLANAVSSTLGASGQCVIYEDARGNPVITKDGVTVAESVVLFDPVENMGATLVKEAARNTVKEAGDGTTTATVLAESLIKEVNKKEYNGKTTREIKEGINSGLDKVNRYLKENALEIKGDMLQNVSAISCNNDLALGKIISEAYEKVGKDGVVLMESSDTENTYVELVDGVQIESGLTSPHFITDTEKQRSILDNPLVLIVGSEIPNVRKIQNILEFAIKNNRSLLIVAPVSQQVKSALLMNKVKGNIKVNIIDLPGFGPTKRDTVEDLAILTGATVVNEELGDDLDGISLDILGEVEKAVTDDKNTVLTTLETIDVSERIEEVTKLKDKEKDGFLKRFLEKRLTMLSGSVAIVRVGADSKVELKEKKDRIEDAIYATKAALKEGIVPGGGIALLNASQYIIPDNVGETILLNAIKAPFETIIRNAGIEDYDEPNVEGNGIDVISGGGVDMVSHGIIDPLLVTKTALKNAISVVSTIISANCVISNIRVNESS